jgi:hypothetical protein
MLIELKCQRFVSGPPLVSASDFLESTQFSQAKADQAVVAAFEEVDKEGIRGSW